ncbi:MAG: hypothetical protein MUP27_09085 [Desulfobacterales bacterium]|nr:hypothetical protein [Desulfobacterales bacterium]
MADKKRTRKPDPGRRLLPCDFRKYLALEDTEKIIDESSGGARGFFQFPKQLKGIQDLNIRDFLVFYFDSKEDYEVARAFFEKPSHARAHPILDEKKLVSLVREKIGG